MSESPKKPVKIEKEIRFGYDLVADTVTVAAGTSSNTVSGTMATQVGGEQTLGYTVSVVATAVMEDPPVPPQAVWTYCTSVSELYDETLRSCIAMALSADVELQSIMGPPDRSRLHRSSVRKRCRQAVAMYNFELRNTISKTTTAKARMHDALRVTIASAVKLACITKSVSNLLIKEQDELPGLEASSSGNAKEEVLAAAAAAPQDLSAAAEAVEEVEAEAAETKTEQQAESENSANEDTRVLAVLIQGFGDLEKCLVRHLQSLEYLIDEEERMADPDDCRYFFDKMRDEFLKQVRRLEEITDDLARRVSAKVLQPPQRPSRLPPTDATARHEAPRKSHSSSNKKRSKHSGKR